MLSRRDLLKSSRNRKKPQKNAGRFVLVYIIIVLALVLVGIVAWQSGNEKISINNIKVKGNLVLSSEEIVKFINDEINGRYLNLFSRRNILIYPKNDLEDKILEKYKRILSIDIYSDNFTSIVVNVKERKPKYLYCGENIFNSDEIGQCYFIDSEGYIFS